MTKLSDSQLVILSAASQREDRAVILPANLKGGPAQKVVAKLLDTGFLKELRATRGLPAWRKDEDNRSYALKVTIEGMKAIGVTEAPAPAHKKEEEPADDAPETAAPVKGKLGQVITLLGRREGASLAELMAATGWQAHSVRGALSGALKKKRGLTITSEGKGEQRRYRIVEGGGK